MVESFDDTGKVEGINELLRELLLLLLLLLVWVRIPFIGFDLLPFIAVLLLLFIPLFVTSLQNYRVYDIQERVLKSLPFSDEAKDNPVTK